MSGCWYSLSFCLARVICHLCQMLPLLVLNLFHKCLEVQLSFVYFFLSFSSLLLLFVRHNCWMTRRRHFIVEKMNNRSNQDMLSSTKTWGPPLWNLTSVKKKEITLSFCSSSISYLDVLCYRQHFVFCLLSCGVWMFHKSFFGRKNQAISPSAGLLGLHKFLLSEAGAREKEGGPNFQH